MYPNPQDALPLPPHPSVEQYKKLAKDLVKSCRSGDPAAVGAWALRWIEALATHQCPRESGRRIRANEAVKRWRGIFFKVRAGRCAIRDRAGAWLPELAEVRAAHRVTRPREFARFRIRSGSACDRHG